MKVSLNWLRQYLDIDLEPAQIGQILTGTGLEVEGIEKVESIPGGLAGVVVGHVVECGPHPGADRLSLTKVDLGGGEPVSIVCGAPNVAAGQHVLVATVGCTLHPLNGEPLTIKKGKIRGEVSEGMICAEDELGLGESHAGIIVLEKPYAPGTPASTVFNLQEDYVYEIGLTPNRSDATNHLGVAFDLAAALSVTQGKTIALKRPDVSAFRAGSKPPLPVQVQDPTQAPRYAGLTIENLQVAPSPDWLRQALQAIGVRPINNVVDVTNYVLHELGQPLHAFDLDKIAGGAIFVEKLPAGTPFVSLDGQVRSLSDDDLMICDGQHQPMCIAGVFGGAGSGVTDGTTRIFLESAHFEAGTTRRSSMRHGLRTDAARVFEKGSDPNITVYALQRAALLLEQIAGGRVSSQLLDLYPQPVAPQQITVRDQRVRDIIGADLARPQVQSIVESMGMNIVSSGPESFVVAVPTNKTDVLREIDVIEEILRIYGFDNVPTPTMITTAMIVAPQPDPHYLRELAGDLLSANGFHEMMALSLSESRFYEPGEDGQPNPSLVYINNTSNVHLDVMRPGLLMSALEAVAHNHNRQQHDLRLFEFGRSYHLDREKPPGKQYREINQLSLTMTGQKRAESWHPAPAGSKNVGFYTLKAAVELLFQRFGIEGYRTDEAPPEGYSYGLRYNKGPLVLADFGAVHPRHLRKRQIKTDVFFAEINWDNVLRVLPRKPVQVTTPGRYPSVRRDLALILDKAVSFAEVERLARKAEKSILREVNLFDVYENAEQLGAGKKSYAVSFQLESEDRTLDDKAVDKVMSAIEGTLTRQLGAEVRR
ncbi:phenylalanine--tRNA ligase subunit beta [Neolewinella lacunae]|uniref:Phenylalanine--tRNA ligase beta subunit n=1 Tax=Neolewinella lacunae TaxID=1517758 RepID=A0A923T5U4_9BACT|nr:phenylalanine--tRNA ligase subunit beta [Neolewinella lacunae]MBC6992695.1 phenylalanine--tRNA ligase subunit beta [Neolewinella lacunae]MDN3633575.1 phenylalanine--tRNA ligase subunit beta [Neolewinella lacunae]